MAYGASIVQDVNQPQRQFLPDTWRDVFEKHTVTPDVYKELYMQVNAYAFKFQNTDRCIARSIESRQASMVQLNGAGGKRPQLPAQPFSSV